MSRNSSTFLSVLELVHVNPVYKKDSRYQKRNYWPVAVLHILSKIVKNVLYNQITSHLDKTYNIKISKWFPKGFESIKLFSSDDRKVQKLFRSGGLICCAKMHSTAYHLT